MKEITFPLKVKTKGRKVAELQGVLQWLLNNGRIPPDDEGARKKHSVAIKKEQVKQYYGAATRKLIALFQASRNLQATGEIDAATATALNKLIGTDTDRDAGNNTRRERNSEELGQFIVRGKVRYSDGIPASGLAVHAFDRDMRSKELLGKGRTDRQGAYEIDYGTQSFRRAEKIRADLVVQVFNGNREVATSDIVFNAEPVEVVDLTLDPKQYQGRSEYERYLREIAPLIENVSVADLTDEDIRFLAGETGISADHLRFLQLDAQWSGRHRLEQCAFYGLFRQGRPTNYRRLLGEKPANLREALKRSIEQTIVPEQLAGKLDGIVERLQALAVDMAFESDDEAATPPLGVLLATSPELRQDQQRQFVRFTLEYDGGGDFWQQAKKRLGDGGAVEAVQKSLQSSVIALHHPPVLKQMQAEMQGSSVKALAGWSAADWLGLVDRAATHGKPVPEGFDNAQDYVSAVVQTVDACLPSERLFARVKKTAKDMPIAPPLLRLYSRLNLTDIVDDPHLDDKAKDERVRETIRQFEGFQDNNPALDLRYADFLQDRFYIAGNLEEIVWGAIAEEDRAPIREQLQAFQRIMLVSADTETRVKLLAAGYDSSYQVMKVHPSKLAVDAQLSPEMVDKIRSAAREQMLRGELARAGIGNLLFDVPLRVDNTDPAVPEALRDLVDIGKLFGTQSQCDCAHCNSVLGQSAYFVDLMAFIDRQVLQSREIFGEEGDPRRESMLYLPNRRPDLWALELSCDGIHRQIPYLQVVNSTLESFLVRRLGLRDNEALYQELAAVRTTFKQPFFPALEELRLYLSHFRLTRFDICRTLGRDASTCALAYLQIGPLERQIIGETDTNEVRVRHLYELAVGDPIAIPMERFVHATGLDRDLVAKLLDAGTLFGHTLRVARNAVEGSFEQKFEEQIVSPDSARGIADLELIHRWIRLWRKTGWSLPAFDFVLGRLRRAGLAAVIDEAAIRRIADLKILQDRLKLTVEELVSLFHVIPAPQLAGREPEALFIEEEGVLFYRLFGSETFAAGPVVIHGFDNEQPAIELPYPDAKRLLAGLGVNEAGNLLWLINALRHDLTTAGTGGERTLELTIENISLLYRHVTLARALTLSLPEFFLLLRLVLGPERTAVASLEEFLQLTEAAAEINELPFSLVELGWLALDQEDESLHRQAAPAQIEELRDRLSTSDEEGLYFILGNIYRWERAECEQLLPLAGVTLEDLKEAATRSDATLAQLFGQLEKWRMLKQNLELGVVHLSFIRENPGLFGDASNLALERVRRIAVYRTITFSKELDPEAVHSVLLALNSGVTGSVSRELAQILNAEASVVESLFTAMDLPAQTMDAVAAVSRAAALCREIGVNGAVLEQVASSDYPSLQRGRDAILAAIQAHYPNEKERQAIVEPFVNRMLEFRRDALVDFLLSPAFRETEPDILLRDTIDLYRFFLMDPEMEGCARTSWVLAGISSLQLYVHRCLMNLEQDSGEPPLVKVPPSAIPREEWAWRKNYRVWEANRKIFLYPENYLDPDLRDDKTPFFEALQDELLQQEISAESVELAYKNYLDKFLKVANMKYAGAYRDGAGVLYLFAHTMEDPSQYHYRTLTPAAATTDKGIWSPWYSIDVAIDAPAVSPIVYQGKLHLFWVEIKTRAQREFFEGNSIFKGFHHYVEVKFTSLTANGRWGSPTAIPFRKILDRPSAGGPLVFRPGVPSEDIPLYVTTYSRVLHGVELDEFVLNGYEWDRIYPRVNASGLRFYYRDSIALDGTTTPASYFHKVSVINKAILQTDERFTEAREFFVVLRNHLKTSQAQDSRKGGRIRRIHVALQERDYSILAINSSKYDFITSIEQDGFLLEPVSRGDASHSFSALRLGTMVGDTIAAILYEKGLDEMLSVETQLKHPEPQAPWEGSGVVSFTPEDRHIDFEGACGNYYRELYFHIPFLIANHLNANQKFAQAQRWYHYIFDPTAPELEAGPEDRYWRYAPFRFQNIQRLREILTDDAALEQYRTDPFNPWAVARLRPGACQKAVVMKYIDNLLDWGDYLFAQDTYESINEATLLYVTALDILGERPVEVGACSVPERITYEKVAEEVAGESDFAVLENVTVSLRAGIVRELSKGAYRHDGTFRVDPGRFALDANAFAGAAAANDDSAMHGDQFAMEAMVVEGGEPARPAAKSKGGVGRGLSWTRPVFCVPPNAHLLGYWDRVADRLFKIRNCMNIDGLRRSLALYDPPIDPALLARAKAAGLALEDVLHNRALQRPLYRFALLLEKARGMASVVQGFGAALVSALEKRDAEQLTLMRTTHEQNILTMTRKVKEKQIQEAQRQQRSLEETQRNLDNRATYYRDLIGTGLTEWERTQQIARHTATLTKSSASFFYGSSSITALLPQLGSPFAITWGGEQVEKATVRWAEFLNNVAGISNDIANSAGLEGTFQRRGQEWTFQLGTAEHELRQVKQQIEAAKLRVDIAVRDLEIYQENVKQSREQYDFIRDKFTRTGLYNWMAQHLSRIYRQAYLSALDLAKQAERAYQFERGDESAYIEPRWEQEKAGLLAAEELTLQLQNLEQAYLTSNHRECEITKSVSLALLAPEQLIRLRETGVCDIHIPEVLFDLDFPGHFRRRIKSVSVTIPCVTGPYTNVSARLTLVQSYLREEADTADLTAHSENVSIATSKAQGDSGLFELNFRDERYLPFEGAGAVSSWRLELSGKWLLDEDGGGEADMVDLSQFDFDTISDVLLNISYTAKEADDDGAFKKSVIRRLRSALNTWLDDLAAAEVPPSRLISVRQEFASAFQQFLEPTRSVHETQVAVASRHFPIFLLNSGISIQDVVLIIKSKEAEDSEHFDRQAFELGKDGAVSSQPLDIDETETDPSWGGLPYANFSGVSGSPVGEWTLRMDPTGLPDNLTEEIDGRRRLRPDVIEDIFLVFRYQVSESS